MSEPEYEWPVEVVEKVARQLAEFSPLYGWQAMLPDARAALRVAGEHIQEREAGIWSAGFHIGRKADPNRANWPANPYRTELNNVDRSS